MVTRPLSSLFQPASIVSIDLGKRNLADVQGHLRAIHPSSHRDHAHYGRDSAGRPGRFSFASVAPLPQVDFPTITEGGTFLCALFVDA